MNENLKENKKLKLGLILSKEFHFGNKWVSAITAKYVNRLIDKYETIWIQNQNDYESCLGDVDFIISYEPNWSSPIIDFKRNSRQSEKFSSIPSYIVLSDPHDNKWREEYLINNEINFVLSYYYSPFIYHFKNTPLEKIIHFPWSIPDEWIPNNKIELRNNKKIKCFGATQSEAYADRKWCMTFPFVERAVNSGVENKIMSDDEYFIWLSRIDAAIAAGSLDKKYRLTLPKYFEILSAGSLLFAQETNDLSKLGIIDNENCIVFNRENFELKVKSYMANPEQYLKFREKGRKLIVDRHTQSKRIEEFDNHLKNQISLKKSKANNPNQVAMVDSILFTNPSEVYIASADRFDTTLNNLNSLKKFDNVHIDRYLTVIGGLSGLNYLLALEPKEIVFFDLNKSAIPYAQLILELIEISDDAEDFITRIFSRSVNDFVRKYNYSKLSIENQNQFLTIAYDENILTDTLIKLSESSKNAFQEYITPFLNNNVLEGTKNCRRLFPCWPINERVPVGGGEDTGYNESGERVPNTNTFYYGYGWLASYNSYNTIKSRLSKAKVIFRSLDLLQSKAEDLFGNHANCVIHYSNIDDWFPEQFKNIVTEWSSKSNKENKSYTLISSANGVINFQPDPHFHAYKSIDKYITGNKIVEVTHKIPWGFHEYNRQNLLVDDYIAQKGIPSDITILHILYGEGCSYEKAISALYYAFKNSKRVLLLEHNKNSMDWTNQKKSLLAVTEIQELIDLSIPEYAERSVTIEFIRGVDDAKRNVLFIIDKKVTVDESNLLNVISVHKINDLRAYYNLSNSGVVIENDLNSVLNDTDINSRKLRDAEVLCNLSANASSDCLEIGTYKGRSAFKLASNLNIKNKVFTVNILPEQYSGDCKLITELLSEDEIGDYYKRRNIKNVQQIFADTQIWEVPNEINELSIAFIDGAHDTDAVYKDSLKVWDRIKPGGFIVWHDFSPTLRNKFDWIDASMNGVEKFIFEKHITEEIIHLKDSFMGVLQKPTYNTIQEDKTKIKILIFYDEYGWAWWHRAKQIQRNISPEISVDILEIGNPFDHSNYDYIIIFDY